MEIPEFMNIKAKLVKEFINGKGKKTLNFLLKR